MGRPRKNFTSFLTGNPAPEIKETSLEAQIKQPEPTHTAPAPKKYDGPRWDYKFFAGPGYKPSNYEAQIDAFGKEGWEFMGVDCYNQNVFRRLIDTD